MAAKTVGTLVTGLLTTSWIEIYVPSVTRRATVDIIINNLEAVTTPSLDLAVTDNTYTTGTPADKFIREAGYALPVDAPLMLTGVSIGPDQSVVAKISETAVVSIVVSGIEEDI